MNSDELLMARLRRYEHPTMDEGAARIERLLVENEMLREELAKHQSNGYERMACSFAAQIVSLREALIPFALHTSDYILNPETPDHGMPANTPHRVGDYRRARAALAGE